MPAKAAAKRQTDILDRARRIIASPIPVEAMIEKLGVREQSAQAKRLAACEAVNPKRAQAWRRLAALLFTLAPARPRTLQRAYQFYIPDGKYQMQVFALDDAQDGTLAVCCENILPAALEAKLLAAQPGQPQRYTVLGTPYAIQVEQLDGKTENPPVYCSAMTGWNRKAMRITLPSDPSKEQSEAAELLCAISSLRWQPADPA